MRKLFHITQSDTFQIGFGWLNKQIYGEGGFFVAVGYLYINFWEYNEY